MQVTPHVYVMHIDDDSVYHPGGSNNYFVGEPREEMLLIDTGDQQREWTRSILDYYAHLGRPKISAILLTHSHQDHIGGLDRIYDVVQELARESGVAVVSVLHDLNLAALYCDRLVLMAEGGVARVGGAADVLTADALRRAYGAEVYVAANALTGAPIVLPRARRRP